MLGTDFLSALEGFVSESDVPLGVELEILWQGVRVVGVLFSADYLLILKIQKKKSNTPSLPLMVGECKKYPADKKVKPIPKKGEHDDKP